jgi:anti-anti-sigma regulatory factor
VQNGLLTLKCPYVTIITAHLLLIFFGYEVEMNKPMDLSEDMYRRVYRLIKRQIDPRLIASTLNIPIKTVQGIISRLEKSNDPNAIIDDLILAEPENLESGFLDIYFYPKTRYAIIQVVGTLSGSHVESFRTELEKANESSFKACAIRMADVSEINEETIKIILTFNEKYLSINRFLAILDPSPGIEPIFQKFNVEERIPIFGTERAFEDAAFSKRSANFIKRI